jgi:hypothetical protein
MAKFSVDARFSFSQTEAKAKCEEVLAGIGVEQQLKLTWVREMAGRFHSADLSGAIVITKVAVHITVDLPWYLAPLEDVLYEGMRQDLTARGFVLP